MLSIQDLIKNQSKKKKAKIETMNIFVAELEGEIKVQVPSPALLAEMIEGIEEEEQAKEVVYNFTLEPKFNDEVLIQTFDCKETPRNIISKLMSKETIFQIAMIITNKSNEKMKDYVVRVVDDIKN